MVGTNCWRWCTCGKILWRRKIAGSGCWRSEITAGEGVLSGEGSGDEGLMREAVEADELL